MTTMVTRSTRAEGRNVLMNETVNDAVWRDERPNGFLHGRSGGEVSGALSAGALRLAAIGI